jgi:hypothetical protein
MIQGETADETPAINDGPEQAISSQSLSSSLSPQIAWPESHATSSPEIIIIGAGIAGSALAYSLSHAGRRVLLTERDLSPPDRIVGELLQPGGVAALNELGMEECLEGIDATPVEGYCVVMGERTVQFRLPNWRRWLERTGGRDGSVLGNGNRGCCVEVWRNRNSE